MFKVGDKVRALNSSLPAFKAGNIYTVCRINESERYRSGIMITVDKDDNGVKNGWCASKFEILQKAPFSTTKPLTLPIDSDARKDIPLFSGCIKYFPAALAGVAALSKKGNDKHNPNEELHHARGKSMDHPDCIVRHLTDVADLLAKLERKEEVDVKTILEEVSSLAWRALAYSQELHEKYAGAPLAPGAKLLNTKETK